MTRSRRTVVLVWVLAVGMALLAGAPGGAADVEAASLDAACPPGQVPPAGFGDIAGNTHEAAIDCVAWYEVSQGTGPAVYAPHASVTRAQMASFVARTLEAAHLELGVDVEPFTDVDGSVHADSINKLASAGIVAGVGDGRYDPNAAITRAQMATFLVRAHEHLTRTPLPAGPDAFGDDDGNTHEDNINKAAAAGFTTGVRPGAFEPAAPVRRDQMASFIARMLDLQVREAYLSVGGGIPLIIPDTTKVLDEAELAALASFDEVSGELVFNDATLDIEPGDVLVGSPTGAAPDGFLQQVTDVAVVDGQLVVSTVQATLTDAIHSGEVVASVPLEFMDTFTGDETTTAQHVGALGTWKPSFNAGFELVLYDADGDHDTTHDQVTGKGSLTTNLEIEVTVRIRRCGLRPCLEQFTFALGGGQQAEIGFTVGGEFATVEQEREFWSQKLPSIRLLIGVVPVWITPTLSAKATLDGSLSAEATAGVEAAWSLRGGVEYRDEQWRPIAESQRSASGSLSVSGEGEVKVAANLSLTTKLYNTAGPKATLERYAQVEAGTTLVNNELQSDWGLYKGWKASAGAEARLPVLGAVASYELTVLDLRDCILGPRCDREGDGADGDDEENGDAEDENGFGGPFDPAAWRGTLTWERVDTYDSQDSDGRRSYGTTTRQATWTFVGDGDATNPSGTQTVQASYDESSTREYAYNHWGETITCVTHISKWFEQSGPSVRQHWGRVVYEADLGWGANIWFNVPGSFHQITERGGPSGCPQETHTDSWGETWRYPSPGTGVSMPRLSAPPDTNELDGRVVDQVSDSTRFVSTWGLVRG